MNKYYTKNTPANSDDDIDFGKQLRNLLNHKRQIATAVLLGGLAGAIYSFSTTPVYRADAMLELGTKQNQILNEISSLFTQEPSQSEAEIELIQSRLIISQTVKELNLDKHIEPKYFPVFGNLAQNLSSDPKPQLDVYTLEVDDAWLNKPIEIEVIDNKSFTATMPDNSNINGQVGKTVQINPKTSLQINQILAEPGQKFTLTKYSQRSAIEKVLTNLSVLSKGKTSPIINLGYTGTDPDQISLILNSIINNYVSQNKNKDVQVAVNGLAFIGEELPRLKEALQDSENRLNEYRRKSGSLDIPIEARGALESLIQIESQITTLKTEEAGLAELYTPEHPSYKAVLDKLRVLQQAKAKINRQIADLPNTQQEIIRLTRDVETNQATYMQLLTKQQELNIMKASAQGHVRIIDPAVSGEYPIKPKKAVIIFLSALMAGLLASSWFLVRSISRRHLTSQEEIEALGTEVTVVIPISPTQNKIQPAAKWLKNNSSAKKHFLLAKQDPSDIAIEAIRSLRTHVHFSTMDAKNNILMISGAAPEAGKSFIASNLASVMAQSDKRVLLIDADMRKGYLDSVFAVDKSEGLAEILSGQTSPEKVIQPTQVPNLSFIGHGKIPDNPSELLMDNRLKALLEWARQRYDYVIIDTPPVLAVTDANIIGQYAGTAFLVVRHNNTTAAELEATLSRLKNNNININGVIFNSVPRNSQNVHSYYAYTKY
ncbi:polysaccharide biosynthesis tyrosine autokinase [Neisseria weaveri]|uniref:polysaccharide biosynthesis tyrosine autokinase n=1 Tax=Neisseria weaveri TaxID=28091 RepID=UPI0007C9CAAC|nr:polysaccharide biosynthesis tyrosine autokinase [Neisseria weaveri]SAY50214.1 Putative tyrosine-protein kinase in cps region [Neisseria weaveri]